LGFAVLKSARPTFEQRSRKNILQSYVNTSGRQKFRAGENIFRLELPGAALGLDLRPPAPVALSERLDIH
jgi:hypothetical protein